MNYTAKVPRHASRFKRFIAYSLKGKLQKLQIRFLPEADFGENQETEGRGKLLLLLQDLPVQNKWTERDQRREYGQSSFSQWPIVFYFHL